MMILVSLLRFLLLAVAQPLLREEQCSRSALGPGGEQSGVTCRPWSPRPAPVPAPLPNSVAPMRPGGIPGATPSCTGSNLRGVRYQLVIPQSNPATGATRQTARRPGPKGGASRSSGYATATSPTELVLGGGGEEERKRGGGGGGGGGGGDGRRRRREEKGGGGGGESLFAIRNTGGGEA